tara:strand:+ start:37 stop:408 length:372 start_codon:yes stop_codon:yes gene_type:complete
MANLQKFRTHEALNTTAAGKFSVADASSGGLGGSAGASISVASTTLHFDLDSGTHQILVYPEGKLYFNFATSDLDIDSDIDLLLPSSTLTSLAVPVGIRTKGETIRFNFASASGTINVRIVEI